MLWGIFMSGYVQADLDKLRVIKQTGATRIEIRGKVTTFRSMSDLARMEQAMVECIKQTAEGDNYTPSCPRAFQLIPCR